MAKHSGRRLSVKKETLRRLDERELGAVAGGTLFQQLSLPMGGFPLGGYGNGGVYLGTVGSPTRTCSCDTTSAHCG